jgi:hypothetical protein
MLQELALAAIEYSIPALQAIWAQKNTGASKRYGLSFITGSLKSATNKRQQKTPLVKERGETE